ALPLAKATGGVIVNARQADAATVFAKPNRTIPLKLTASRQRTSPRWGAHDQTNPSATPRTSGQSINQTNPSVRRSARTRCRAPPAGLVTVRPSTKRTRACVDLTQHAATPDYQTNPRLRGTHA